MEYLTLGGTGDLEWFRDHLRDPTAVDAGMECEHALVLDMFTELFADEGIRPRVV